jgi:nonsense-mediated mRNA decay protein 3
MCDQCLQTQVDITEGIPKQVIIHHCRGCERFLRPPWVAVQPESRELLAVCLRKIRGLNKVKLIDAGFIWTEPHSKRIKVRLTIQKEVFSGVVLQQVFPVEFVVTNMFCEDCHAEAASNTWKACVQVRQRVPHKRTILYLEQLILKHDAHSYALSIKSQPEGIDFFFGERSHALRFISFLESVTPLRTSSAKELVSADLKSNVMSYKFTYFAEIVPLCKHDLMAIPKALAAKCGQINQVVLCERVTTGIHIIDPRTGQKNSFTQDRFWHLGPFTPMAVSPQLTQFIVLDCELLEDRSSQLSQAKTAAINNAGKRKRGDDATAAMMATPQRRRGGRVGLVELVKATDLGMNDEKYTCTTHMGHLLKSGDHVLGYALENINYNPSDTQGLDESKFPNIVIVRKYYPKTYKTLQKHGRGWRLRALNVEDEPIDYGNDKRAKKKQLKKDQLAAAQRAKDLEALMQDLQEDGEMRSKINLYRNDTATGSAVTGLAAATTTRSGTSEDTKMKGGGVLGSDDESDLEDDFPEIQLSELLDDMSLGGGAVHGEVHVHSNGKVAASSQVGGNVAASSRPSAIARHQATAEGEVFMGKTNWAHSKGVKDDILAGVNFTGVQGRDGVDQALEDPEFDDDL